MQFNEKSLEWSVIEKVLIWGLSLRKGIAHLMSKATHACPQYLAGHSRA